MHSWHQRHPQELPCIGQGVRLHLQVKRFRCRNGSCPQKTFVERFPDWLPAYARRTTRLTEVLRRSAFAMSAEAAHRLLKHFQIIASGDTLLRIIRQTHLPAIEVPQIVGIDDWALKKRAHYGTLVVDLQQHRVIDLLLERTSTVVATWLKQHPSVEIVTRDRSTEYAAGITEGAPQAQQVADRWHLLLNLRQMLDRFLSKIYPRLQQLPLAPQHLALLRQQRAAFRRTRSEQIATQNSREKRLAKYAEIQHLRQAGYNISQIANQLGHHWETVRKYYEATSFPERKQRRPGPSILDPYLPYLYQRLQEGCENALQLWREIQQRGYPGSSRQVSKWMQLHRTTPAPSTPKRHTLSGSPQTSSANLLPSSKQMAWLLVREPDRLTSEEVAVIEHLQQDADIAHVYALAQQFVQMVKQRLVEQLDPWLERCEMVNAAPVHNFALSLRQDYAAIRAALQTPWSNGQTEGQVNRLKFIKRQMYGRASFDLLRLKVIYSSGFT
jgi:transposase